MNTQIKRVYCFLIISTLACIIIIEIDKTEKHAVYLSDKVKKDVVMVIN